MPEKKTRRSSSSFDDYSKPKKPSIFSQKFHLSDKELTSGIVIGIVLTLVTIALHCVAYLTPHWKEISPKTSSVYVDGIDALIRTEILIYFNTVHRFTRQSYGLFQRCEYLLKNITKLLPEHRENYSNDLNSYFKTCTKNFLPTYTDEKFNDCHSLQYYRFCSKTNGKSFDVKNDFLRAKYGIISNSADESSLLSSCDCYYPEYISACQVLGLIALICLILTVISYGLFPCVQSRHARLKYKCLCILFWTLSMIFIFINILVVKSYLEYESLEYITTIEKHYRLSQIYTLSQDAKTATERFRSSIQIETGWSTKLAWIAFILSFIDGILIIFTCKVSHLRDDIIVNSTNIHDDEPQFLPANDHNEDPKPGSVVTPLASRQSSTVSRILQPVSLSFSPSLSTSLTTMSINNPGEQLQRPQSRPSCLKGSPTSRIHFEDNL